VNESSVKKGLHATCILTPQTHMHDIHMHDIHMHTHTHKHTDNAPLVSLGSGLAVPETVLSKHLHLKRKGGKNSEHFIL